MGVIGAITDPTRSRACIQLAAKIGPHYGSLQQISQILCRAKHGDIQVIHLGAHVGATIGSERLALGPMRECAYLHVCLDALVSRKMAWREAC